MCSGDDGVEQKALLKSQELEATKQRLVDLKEQPVEFEGNQIPRIEKELLTFFRNKLDADLRYQSADGDLRYEVEENRVVMISFSGSYASPKRMTSALEFVRLFTKLQVLDCSDTTTTVLPELPQSLQWLDCRNTPAFQKTETDEQLRTFARQHPGFSYEI